MSYSSSSSMYPVGALMQPSCDFGYTLNCAHHPNCGRIRCEGEGSWKPVDSELVSTCIPATGDRVLSSIGNDSDENGERKYNHTFLFVFFSVF